MSERMNRAERAARNRTLLLAAARKVFLERGYHGASVDQIADAAGFSTGVVYSQFGGKADLFLALLENRIAERAAGNAEVADRFAGDRGVVRLLQHAASVDEADPDWGLLVIEFRVHAARDPELNRRYAAAHEQTLARMERTVAGLYERAGEPPPLPPADLARLLLTVGAGARLEQAAEPGSSPMTSLAGFVARLVELASSATGPAADQGEGR